MVWEREREEEYGRWQIGFVFFFLFDRLTMIAILTEANDNDDYQIDHHNLSTLKTLKGCSHCLWWIRFDCLQLIDVVEWVWKIDDQNMHMHIWMNEWMNGAIPMEIIAIAVIVSSVKMYANRPSCNCLFAIVEPNPSDLIGSTQPLNKHLQPFLVLCVYCICVWLCLPSSVIHLHIFMC